LDCRGTHLIADLFGCRGLDDQALIDAAMRAAVARIGATLIGLHLHGFGDGQGVTGVAMLAESHLSIHTWPEHGYAAIDLFVCGRDRDVAAGVALIGERLRAEKLEVRQLQRGDVNS
jgi:S-adenosylmethionine decarboxylase